MLAAVTKAGVTHMICHNYRRIPAVMLTKQLIAEGQLGEIRHFRGTYLQDWITDPKFPLVWRLDKQQGRLGRARRHRRALDRPRPLPRRRNRGSGRRPEDVRQDPAPAGQPEEDRPRDRGRRVDVAGTLQERRDRHDRGKPDGGRAQELQPVRDQREPGQRGVRSGAHERARGLLREGQAARARLPPHPGHRSRAPVLQGVVAGRAHHRLRAHLRAHGVRPARGHGGRQGADAELRGRRAQPARARRDRKSRREPAVGNAASRGSGIGDRWDQGSGISDDLLAHGPRTRPSRG